MATFDLGRVTPLYKGDYSASASYELNDVVLYNGNLYWHVQATATVGILPTDTTVWKLAFADEGVRAEIRGYADNAQASADTALASKSAAATSASNASASASQAALSAQAAQTAETGASASASAAATSATNSAASAQSAASSAQTATDKATLASQKAAAASESASLATAKASAAATSETNAITAASTATTKASEAAASATSAQEYDESAQQSAVNAQTAQGLAETAQTAAETAQGLAEDARDLAQQYAESIDPEHIYSAYPTDTAEGSIASFADGANDIPLKSLVVDINPVQSGSGDPSPDNVRPISGWSEVNVETSGKNIANAKYGIKVPSIISGQMVNEEGWSTEYIKVDNSKTYRVSVGNNSTSYLLYYDYNLAFLGCRQFKGGIRVDVESYFSGASYIKLRNDAAENNNPNIQLELGTTSTAYEPYSGQSINIPLGQTVYGGHLDVLSGVLTVDRAMVTLSELSCAKYVSSTYQTFGANLPETMATGTNIALVQCSTWKGVPQTQTPAGGDNYVWGSSVDGTIRIKSTAYENMTVDEFKAAFADTQFVYKLAAPITIQLTPHEVKSLYGQNNIFADTGDTAAEYRADTKLYIERLTEPDADMIADANVVSGQYFMVGNSLYLATANIASGSAVIEGTNATRKSLSEALNEINQ